MCHLELTQKLFRVKTKKSLQFEKLSSGSKQLGNFSDFACLYWGRHGACWGNFPSSLYVKKWPALIYSSRAIEWYIIDFLERYISAIAPIKIWKMSRDVPHMIWTIIPQVTRPNLRKMLSRFSVLLCVDVLFAEYIMIRSTKIISSIGYTSSDRSTL